MYSIIWDSIFLIIQGSMVTTYKAQCPLYCSFDSHYFLFKMFYMWNNHMFTSWLQAIERADTEAVVGPGALRTVEVSPIFPNKLTDEHSRGINKGLRSYNHYVWDWCYDFQSKAAIGWNHCQMCWFIRKNIWKCFWRSTSEYFF